MKKTLLFCLSCGVMAATAVFAADPASDDTSSDSNQEVDGVKEHGKVVHELNPHFGKVQASRVSRGNGISYHGGPVMTGGANVYLIWYGNWSGNSATTIVTDFLNNEGGSPYFKINTTYYNGNNVHIVNNVDYSGSTTDNYSLGTALSDAQIQTIVSSAINSGGLPKDPNGVYFVLTSADVTATSGFCTQYCGWHTHGTIGGSDTKYAFVGNPDRCPNG